MNCLWCDSRIQETDAVCTRCGAPNKTEVVKISSQTMGQFLQQIENTQPSYTEVRGGIDGKLLYRYVHEEQKEYIRRELIQTDKNGYAIGFGEFPQKGIILINCDNGDSHVYENKHACLFDGKHNLGLEPNQHYEAIYQFLK